jgi:hypothetical protein
LNIQPPVRFIEAQKCIHSGGARLLHLHFQIGANTTHPAWLIRGENRASSNLQEDFEDAFRRCIPNYELDEIHNRFRAETAS